MDSSRRLDILYVGTLPPHPGGTAILACQLLDRLARRGHRVRAIAPIAVGCDDALSIPDVEVMRYQVAHFSPSPDRPAPRGLRDAEGAAIRRCFDACLGRRPDIVIAGRETFAWHVPELAERHRLPWVLLVQGATTFGILRQSLPESERRDLLKRFQRATRTVVVAEHLAPKLEALGVRHVEVISNGVDLARFLPRPTPEALKRQLRLPADAIVAMHVSNLKALKRPLDVVASARLALEADPRLVYVIVGDGPLRGELESAVDERWRRSFRFIGWQPHAAMPELMALADLVLMPSQAEARALVYLETMASGRVLIASAIDAALEVISPGETGLVFETGDVQALSELTLLAAGSPELRERLGRAAARAARAWEMAAMVDAYERLLIRTISGEGS